MVKSSGRKAGRLRKRARRGGFFERQERREDDRARAQLRREVEESIRFELEAEGRRHAIGDVTQPSDPRRHALFGGRALTHDVQDEFNDYLRGDGIFETRDSLLREKGYRVLDRMADQDADVANGHNVKRSMRLSAGWSLKPARKASPLAEEIRDFVKWNFEHGCNCSIESFLMKMWDATRQGFKIAEMIWHVIPEGRYAGMIGLKGLKVRNSRNYSFKAKNRAGDIHPLGIVEGMSPTGLQVAEALRFLPTNKFIIYTYNALDDDLVSRYGRSDFRPVWRYFYGQLMAHSNVLRAGETFIRPPGILKAEDGRFTKPQQRKWLKDAANVYNRQVTMLPAGMTFDTIETKREHTGLKDMMAFHTDQIGKGLGSGPFQQSAKGSQGTSRSELDDIQTFLYLLDALGVDTSVNIMRPLMRNMVAFNFDFIELTPIFCMPRLSINRSVRTSIVKDLVESGAVDPQEEWIRDFVDVPEQPVSIRSELMNDAEADNDPLAPPLDEGEEEPEVKDEPEITEEEREEMSERDAPNYQMSGPVDASRGEICHTCGWANSDVSYCSLYRFFFRQGFRCDSWAHPNEIEARFSDQVTGDWYLSLQRGEVVDIGGTPPRDLTPLPDDNPIRSAYCLLQEMDNGQTSFRSIVRTKTKAIEIAKRVVDRRPDVRVIVARMVGRQAGRRTILRALYLFTPKDRNSMIAFRPVGEEAEEEIKKAEAEISFQAGMRIQTLILSKEKFKTEEQARAWVKEHDFKVSHKGKGVDETGNSFRFRQADPGGFEAGSFRTKRIDDGVSAVFARPKNS